MTEINQEDDVDTRQLYQSQFNSETISDAWLGRLMRFHPERFVGPGNSQPVIEYVEQIVEQIKIVPVVEYVRMADEPKITPIPDNEPITPRPSMRIIRNEVARFFQIPISEMLSQRRNGPVVRARQMAMFLCKELTSASLPSVGEKLGGRDHTTVMHACRKMRGLYEADADIREQIDTLKGRIASRVGEQETALVAAE